jgi:hypothetical protein
MIVHEILAQAAAAVVSGTVGAVAYDLLRTVAAKTPIREAAVTTVVWDYAACAKLRKAPDRHVSPWPM